MASTDAVRYERRGAVAWLTIDRPEAHNALSAAVREGLFAGFEGFEADDSAQVLVLTAAGEKAFCAGGDLKEMAAKGIEIPPPDFMRSLGGATPVADWTAPGDGAIGYSRADLRGPSRRDGAGESRRCGGQAGG